MKYLDRDKYPKKAFFEFVLQFRVLCTGTKSGKLN
jgi:hypothetical protein